MFLMYFLFFALNIVSLCYAMEQKFQKPKTTIAIRCSDGNVIGVQEDIALQSITIRNCLLNSHEEYSADGEKEYDSDDKRIEFIKEYGPLGGFFDKKGEDAQHRRLDLGSQILKKLFDCIADEHEIKKLTKEELVDVFQAGTYLDVPYTTMRALALYAHENIPFTDQPELVRCGYYTRSIRSLLQKNELKVQCEVFQNMYGMNIGSLYIWDQAIDSLEGIEEVAKRYEKICINQLCLDNNNIKSVDISKLLVCLPFIDTVLLRNNVIDTLKLPKKLRFGMSVELDNNNIQELPHFKVGEKSHIALYDNPLSQQAMYVARNAALPTFYEKYRHHIKGFTDPRSIVQSLGITGSVVGGLFISSNYIRNRFLSKTILNYSDLDYKDFLVWTVVFAGFMKLHFDFYREQNLRYKYEPGSVVFDSKED